MPLARRARPGRVDHFVLPFEGKRITSKQEMRELSATVPNVDEAVRAKALAPTGWPWVSPILAARLTLVLLLFLGLLSFAAVRQMANQCSREPIYRSTSDGAARVTSQGDARSVDGKHLGCRTPWGDYGMNIRLWSGL